MEGCLAFKGFPCVNFLTSLPAEIGQLASLNRLNLRGNKLTSVPASIINELRARGCAVLTNI